MTREDMSERWRVGERLSCGLRGFAAESDFDGFRVKSLRQQIVQIREHSRRKIDIVSPARLLVVKMRVRSKIGTVTRGTALKIYRSHQVTLHQRLETIVDGRERNGRQFGLHANVNLVCGGVVALVKQHIVNDLALRGGAEPAVGEPLGERFRVFGRHEF